MRSLHGRAGSILGAVSYHKRTFVLTGGAQAAPIVCQTLADADLGGLTVHLGENLGAADERIETGAAAVLAGKPCGGLAVLLIEHPDAANAREPVRDAMLARGDVPMTKEEVRWVSVSKLAVQPRDTVWDVGAGTGAVTLELARRASDGLVYAVERSADAVKLLGESRRRLGGYNVRMIDGAAPAARSKPCPRLTACSSAGAAARCGAFCKPQSVRIQPCAWQSTPSRWKRCDAAQAALAELGFAEIEVVQLAAARGRVVGPVRRRRTANDPVVHPVGERGRRDAGQCAPPAARWRVPARAAARPP